MYPINIIKLIIPVPVLPLPWLQCMAITPSFEPENILLFTFEEIVHRKPNINQGCQSWSLMVGPIVILDFVLELPIVIQSITDVKYEIISLVLIVKVFCHISDIISIHFLESSASRKSHSNEPLADIGQIEIFSLIFHHLLRPSHHLPHEVKHTQCKYLTN